MERMVYVGLDFHSDGCRCASGDDGNGDVRFYD